VHEGGYDDYEVVEELTGEEMVGWEYDHPLRDEVPDAPDFEGALQVYDADYVEADRTGLVHSAPGHGEEDFERGRELGLDIFCPVGATASTTSGRVSTPASTSRTSTTASSRICGPRG